MQFPISAVRDEHLMVEALTPARSPGRPSGQRSEVLWRGQVAGRSFALAGLLVGALDSARPGGYSFLTGGDGLTITAAVGACIAETTLASSRGG